MNRNIFYKIILLFLIPVLGVMYYSTVYIFDKYDYVNEIKRINKVITYLDQAEKLINEIQFERGLSSLYIGSSKKKFAESLKKQRIKTDISYKNYISYLSNSKIKDIENINIIKKIIKQKNALDKLRDTIDKNSGLFFDIFKKFTDINTDLILSIEYFNNQEKYNIVPIKLNTLINIIKIKEYVGVERGLLSKVFSEKRFAHQDEYITFMNSISIQKIYTEEFLLNTNKKSINIYHKYNENIDNKMDFFREKAIKINAQSTFTVDPIAWWEVSSNRVQKYSLMAHELVELFKTDANEITSDSYMKLYLSLFIWLGGFTSLLIGLNLLNKLVLMEEKNYIQLEQQKYIYNMLTHTNELIIHDYLQDQVYREICAIAVDKSDLSLAYVGVLEENGDIDIVACDGKATAYVDKLSLTSNPNHDNKQLGIAGKAIQDDKNIIINDILADKSSPLCAHAYEYHLRSAGVYPLRKFNKIVGVLVIYAKEVNFFNHDIDLLFDRIATNISFGIEKIHYETVRKEDEQKLIYKAQHDSLTDLPNRMLFMDRLEYSIKVKSRTKIKGAVIFIDLDNFKPVNDTFGHHVGDLVLIKVAKILQDQTRAEDTVARLGGDEFVVLIDSLDGEDSKENEELLVSIGTKIRKSIEEPIVSDDDVVNISASIGIVMFPDGFHNPNEIVKFADEAMYESKNSGKNQIRFYQK